MRYLIEKRGLYYRPKSCGYTGLKREAGKYTLDEVSLHFPNIDSPNQDGMIFISESDAPDYSTACAWDVRLKDRAYRSGLLDGARAMQEAASDRLRILGDMGGMEIVRDIDPDEVVRREDSK